MSNIGDLTAKAARLFIRGRAASWCHH